MLFKFIGGPFVFYLSLPCIIYLIDGYTSFYFYGRLVFSDMNVFLEQSVILLILFYFVSIVVDYAFDLDL